MRNFLVFMFLIAVIPFRIIGGLILYFFKHDSEHLYHGLGEAFMFWRPLHKTSLVGKKSKKKKQD